MSKQYTTYKYSALDAASIIVIATSLLYLFGTSRLAGKLIAYNLPGAIVDVDLYSAISTGFFTLLTSFVFAPIEASMAAFFSALAFLYKYKIKKPVFGFYILLLFAITSQISASFAAGKYLASNELQDISDAHKENDKTEAFLKKTVVTHTIDNGNIKTSSGFLLDIPSDYIIIETNGKIIVINKKNISTIEFE